MFLAILLWYNLELDTGVTRQRIELEEWQCQGLVSMSDMGTFRQSPRTEEAKEVQALTAGHDLPLQLVPGQVQDPEDGIVQEDQEENEEEVPD